MSTNAETKFFDYVKGELKDVKSSEAQQLLDEALDSWAEKNSKEKNDCPWLENGKEYVLRLRELEEAQGKSEEELKEKFDKLAATITALTAYKTNLLKAEIAAQNKGPAEKNWEANLAYFQKHPFAGLASMLASGIRLLWSGELFGKKEAVEDNENDEHVDLGDKSPVEGKDLFEYSSLRLDLPSNAKFTSDIQSHRKSTGRRHSGIDIAMPEGTPLKSPGKGVVVKADTEANSPSNGNYVFIKYKVDGKTVIFCFLHLKSPSPLKKDQVVDEQTILGEVGHTGSVIAGKGGNGDHLHFQVYDDHWNLEDPLQFLPSEVGDNILAKRNEAATKDALWDADGASHQA